MLNQLYNVDSNPVGTQVTGARTYIIYWRASPLPNLSRVKLRKTKNASTSLLLNKMHNLGTSIEVVTDHVFLASLNFNSGKIKQLHTERHQTKILLFLYHITCESGTKPSCDYGFRHLPKQEYTDEIIHKWGLKNDKDIFVNRVTELSPKAVNMIIKGNRILAQPGIYPSNFDVW